MIGVNAETGKALSGIDHLRQSVADILTTPIGSRVMRRDYGSGLFELIDRPMTPELVIDCYAATAEALDRWEPRLRLSQVQITAMDEGRQTLTLTGRYLPEGRDITLEGIVL